MVGVFQIMVQIIRQTVESSFELEKQEPLNISFINIIIHISIIGGFRKNLYS